MLTSTKPRAAAVASDGALLLLAELNHRVDNEVQAALAALRLARRGLAGGEPVRFIEEAAVRLQCFGTVHQLLDRQRSQAPLARRLEALCLATSLAKGETLGTHIRLRLDDVATDEETAWTICVVAFELMTNAFKHAFPGGPPGVIGVVLQQDGGEVILTVTDDGVGMGGEGRSAEAVWQAPGFGSGIVTRLADHLGGSVTRVSGPVGTVATFSAPLTRRMQ